MMNDRPGRSLGAGAFHAVLIPSREALAVIPSRMAKEFGVLPLSIKGRVLVCAAHQMLSDFQVGELRRQAGRDVKFVMASSDAVLSALDRGYAAAPAPEADDLVLAVAQDKRRSRTRLVIHEKSMRRAQARIIAVTGGKGGVGKTSLCANMAVALAKDGWRVAVIDCDFGLSNLHVALGIRPERGLSDMLVGGLSMEEAMLIGPAGVRVLTGVSGSSDMAQLDFAALESAGLSLSRLRDSFDYVFFDTAAGIQSGVISVLRQADQVVMVMTPDPSSVQDAYLTTQQLLESNPRVRIAALVNNSENPAESRRVVTRYQSFVQRYRGGAVQYLGSIAFDEKVMRASRRQTPVVLEDAGCRASRDIEEAAFRIAGLEPPERAGWLPWGRRKSEPMPKGA